jgi:hypothetical protein
MEMWLGERVPTPDDMYPTSPFVRFKRNGPHYVPFVSLEHPTWQVLRRIHLCPDPRGGAFIYNHRATRQIYYDHPDSVSSSPGDDHCDDNAGTYAVHTASSDDGSDYDDAALDDASDLDFHEADLSSNSCSD